MKILVTGFDPFGGETVNPAWEAVSRLPDTLGGAEIVKRQIPTVRWKSLEKIREMIGELHPDMVISVGQAGGRKDITPERIGINCDDFRIADNEGNTAEDEKIYEDGPDAYFVTLPVRKMVAAVNAAGISSSLSNTAGTYICNHVTYGTRYYCEHEHPQIRSGFIHVPYLDTQVKDKEGVPSMTLEEIVKGLSAAVTAAAEDLQ